MGVIKNLLIRIRAEDEDAKKKLENVEAAVDKVKTTAASAGKKVAEAVPKSVELDVKTNGAEKKLDAVATESGKAKKALKETREETKKSPGGFFDRLASKINSTTKSTEELKRAMEGSVIGSLLAPAAAVMAILNSAAQIGAAAWDAYLTRLREGAERAADVRAQMEKLQQVNETRRNSDAAALNKLQQMAVTEQLSNTQKAQAVELIKQLSGSYGNLGIAIDSVTGKITGLDEAQAAMQARNYTDRLREQQRVIKQLETEARQWRNTSERATAVHVGGVSIGGEQAAMDAAQKEKETVDKLLDARRQLRELQKQNPETQRKLGADTLIASDQEQLKIRQLRNAGQNEEADKLEFTIGLRSRGVALTEKEREKLWEINRAMAAETVKAEELEKEKAAAAAAEEEIKRKAEERRKYYDDALSQADYELKMAELKKQGLDDEAAKLELINELRGRGITLSGEELNRLLEKRKAARAAEDAAQKAAQNKAAEKQKKTDSRTYATDAVEDAEYQLKLQKLKNAGLDDEADRLELLHELKERNLDLTEEEIAKILAARKNLRELQNGGSDRVTVGNERQETDSLRKIGLYNWGSSAVSSLDRKRNTLLGEIRDGVNKLWTKDSGDALS